MKLLSVQLGPSAKLGPHRVEVETVPAWWERLFGVRPQRHAYEGGIVWRHTETGARPQGYVERWLEEQAGGAWYLQHREAT